jgi:hypothetical protein
LPIRTLGLETLRAKPGRNRKDRYADLTKIEDSDVLHLFHGFFNDLDPDLLRDEVSGKYVRIDDIIVTGRTVVLVAESGHFGERGQTIDVRTHQTAYSHTADESPTAMTRLGFTVAPGATTGLFCVERAGRATAAPTLIAMFRHALIAKFNTFSWPTETIVQTDAWMQASELEEVRAVVDAVAYAVPTDIANGVGAKRKFVGRVEHTLLPPKGSKRLPKWLWDMIRTGNIHASEFLGFDGQDIDETTVVATKDGQHKRFNIQKQKTPAIRVVLTGQGEEPMTDIDFLRRCQDEAREFYDGMGLTWQETWRDGQWTPEALAATLPPH